MKIIGIKGDAEIHTIEGAVQIYGEDVIQGILDDDGNEYLDDDGNTLWPVFDTDE
jgi:hypothetical protein